MEPDRPYPHRHSPLRLPGAAQPTIRAAAFAAQLRKAIPLMRARATRGFSGLEMHQVAGRGTDAEAKAEARRMECSQVACGIGGAPRGRNNGCIFLFNPGLSTSPLQRGAACVRRRPWHLCPPSRFPNSMCAAGAGWRPNLRVGCRCRLNLDPTCYEVHVHVRPT